jgi:prepilin-type N-terminal cleavage/methylation domain-containing protein/prepilin-type processing-associated H-X9-DG protein
MSSMSQRMKTRSAPRLPSGFTLIELLVVIAIIAILAAILFPVFAKARDRARQSACLNNLKQTGTALMMYIDNWDETYPAKRADCGIGCWDDGYIAKQLNPLLKSKDVWKCPNDFGAPWASKETVFEERGSSYFYEFHCAFYPADQPVSSGDIKNPARRLMNYDHSVHARAWQDTKQWSWHDRNRETYKNNVAFADGHAKFIPIHESVTSVTIEQVSKDGNYEW